MSKAVKKIGRSLTRVVKGAGKLAKKVYKSPIGKALMVAGTVYFGGAALSGAMAGGSGGALSGAMTGISNAWSGLTTAASSAMSGNFGTAGAALKAGASGSTLADSLMVNAGTRASGMAGISAAGKSNAAALDAAKVPQGLLKRGATQIPNAAPTAAPASSLDQALKVVKEQAPDMLTEDPAKQGLLSKILTNPYTVPVAMQLGGQALSGYAQQKGAEEASDEDRKRYNANIGGYGYKSAY